MALTAAPKPRFLALASMAALCLALAGCAGPGVRDGHMRVRVMDLGEADCTLIQTSDASCLIDAGETDSAPAILRCLRRSGVRRIDLAVLSHPHTDHIGGMSGLLRQVRTGTILDSGFPLGTGVQRKLLKSVSASKTRYVRAHTGQTLRLGRDLVIEVLWPPPDGFLTGTESDANNNSVVLAIKHGKVRLLFVGDLQEQGENRLVASRADLAADLLKIGHQGSDDASSSAFLSRVRPAIAVIAVGEHNSYGHPSGRTLERLRRSGATVLRTDTDGEIVIESDGEKLQVSRP